MCLLVDSLGVGFYFCLYLLLELGSLQLILGRHLFPKHQVLAFLDGESSSPPLPLQLSLAPALGLVEKAARAGLIIDYGDGLKPIGQDDVRVHCGHVNVINQRISLELVRVLDVSEPLQSTDDLRLYFR